MQFKLFALVQGMIRHYTFKKHIKGIKPSSSRINLMQ